MVCAIRDECEARFFSGELSSQTQFARDLLGHLDLLHGDGHLTAPFLRLAFDRLGETTPLDTNFRGLVDDAVACLEAQQANRD